MIFNHRFTSPSSESSNSLKLAHFHSSLHNNISATMHATTTTTLFLAAIASFAYAEELKAGDVPSACKAICGPIVTLTNCCTHARERIW